MSLFVRPAAAAEIEAAFGWYEDQRDGLGEELLSELDVIVRAVLESPSRFTVAYRDTRRVLLRRFPYSVFYRIQGEDVVLAAFFHGSRDPQIWRDRE
jgi:plasmid stabilization system protein ParE